MWNGLECLPGWNGEADWNSLELYGYIIKYLFTRAGLLRIHSGHSMLASGWSIGVPMYRVVYIYGHYYCGSVSTKYNTVTEFPIYKVYYEKSKFPGKQKYTYIYVIVIFYLHALFKHAFDTHSFRETICDNS